MQNFGRTGARIDEPGASSPRYGGERRWNPSLHEMQERIDDSLVIRRLPIVALGFGALALDPVVALRQE
jgi:hypothetical protein